MEMRVNSQLIRKLRDERSWSQEHLAAVSGLSARTIQRIETEGNASPESRMALASAFGIDVAALAVAEGIDGSAPVREVAATGRASPAWHRWRHVAIYLLVCSGLVIVDVSRSGSITWSKWPLIGWGLGLLFHWLRHRERATVPAATNP